MTAIPEFLSRFGGLVRRLRTNTRGNVLMIFGLAIIPLTFATGMGIDYGRAMRLQTKLNAAADAAALTAVSQQVMDWDIPSATAAAKAMFVSQTTGLPGLVINYNDTKQLAVNVVDTPGATNSRTATVTYRAQSSNAFAGVLGWQTLTIKGASSTNATVAPNIDFYVMMDVSQSMLLPATSSGLSAMVAATPTEGGGKGCAFACHQTLRNYNAKNPDNSPNEIINNPADPSDNTKPLDNYMLARKLNIVLRTDLVTEAVQSLMDVATSTSTNNKAKYRMGISSFDFGFQKVWPTASSPYVDANLSTVKTHVADAVVQPYYFNNWRTSGNNDSDKGTATTSAFTGILNTMPTLPGGGSNKPGDTPQVILFIITDGMRDETRPGNRPEGPIDTSYCTTVKNRGIRIAVLYTEYLPASASDQWSQDNVKTPYLSPTDKISPALISCASDGLYYKVTTDDDIAAALNSLFQKAVATAHIIT